MLAVIDVGESDFAGRIALRAGEAVEGASLKARERFDATLASRCVLATLGAGRPVRVLATDSDALGRRLPGPPPRWTCSGG